MFIILTNEIRFSWIYEQYVFFIYLLRTNKQVVEDKVQQIYELCSSSKQSAGLCFHNPSGYNITESPNSSWVPQHWLFKSLERNGMLLFWYLMVLHLYSCTNFGVLLVWLLLGAFVNSVWSFFKSLLAKLMHSWVLLR